MCYCLWGLVGFFTNARDGMSLLILTMPGSIVINIIFYFTGLFELVNIERFIVLVCAFVGGTANTLGLYLLGYLLNKNVWISKKAVWEKVKATQSKKPSPKAMSS